MEQFGAESDFSLINQGAERPDAGVDSMIDHFAGAVSV